MIALLMHRFSNNLSKQDVAGISLGKAASYNHQTIQSHFLPFPTVFGVYGLPLTDTSHFGLTSFRGSMVQIPNAQLMPLN